MIVCKVFDLMSRRSKDDTQAELEETFFVRQRVAQVWQVDR